MNSLLQMIVGGLLRHLLSGIGTALVTKGLTTDSDWEKVAGGLSVLLGIGWSLYQKHQVNQATKVIQPPITGRGGAGGLMSCLIFCFLLSAFCFCAHGQTFKNELPPTQDHFARLAAAPDTGASVTDTNLSPTITGGIAQIGEAILNDATNWYVIPYAVRAGNRWGYGLCIAIPVSQYVVTDLRVEGDAGTIYGVSGSVTLQYPMRTFGVAWTPFTYIGVGEPISGKSIGGVVIPGNAAANGDPQAIYGYGVAIELYHGPQLNIGLIGDIETWGTAPKSYRFGPMFNYQGKVGGSIFG